MYSDISAFDIPVRFVIIKERNECETRGLKEFERS